MSASWGGEEQGADEVKSEPGMKWKNSMRPGALHACGCQPACRAGNGSSGYCLFPLSALRKLSDAQSELRTCSSHPADDSDTHTLRCIQEMHFSWLLTVCSLSQISFI